MRDFRWWARTLAPCAVAALLFSGATGAGARAGALCPAEGWVLAVPDPNPSRPNTLGGISGLVALGGDRFLSAHDAKRKFDTDPTKPATRLHRLTLRPDGTVDRLPLTWSGTQANDLESLALLPGPDGDVLALESGEDPAKGSWYHLRLGTDTVEVRATGSLEAPPPQVEGFALASLGGRLVAVWAGRGHGTTPADLRWGTVERAPDGRVTRIAAAPGRAALTAAFPDPTQETTRHVSALALNACGDLWATSTTDPGNDGPYASALYHAGRFAWRCGALSFTPSACCTPWRRFAKHKAEALLLTPRGPILASDDENCGGWLLLMGR